MRAMAVPESWPNRTHGAAIARAGLGDAAEDNQQVNPLVRQLGLAEVQKRDATVPDEGHRPLQRG